MLGSEFSRRQLLVAGACGLAFPPVRARAESGAVVRTPAGRVQGAFVDGGLRFLGIPYGAAPGRFERARPVAWSGVRDALTFGPIAPQLSSPGGQGAPMAEACQVLNVYTPGLGGKPRPVMFWCHGGGFQSGSASTTAFDGTALAHAHDVVVVTINHRLGPLGALRLDHLDPRFADAGRVGMLDIVDALRWVRGSIAGFGGDPNRVMVFGQSGGGGKVLTLLTMPEACTLFHAAVVQSGTMRQTSATPEEGVETTGQLMRELGLRADDVDQLRAMPLDRLLDAQAKLMQTRVPGLRPFSPVIDGKALPEQPFSGRAPRCSTHIPMIVGTTTEELRVFNLRRPELFALDWAGLRRELLPLLGIDSDVAILTYRSANPQASPSDIYFRITADEMYGSNCDRVVELAARRQAPVYSYRFNFDPSRATRGDKPSGGAGHGAEIAHIFRRPPAGAGAEGRDLSRAIGSAWAAFAATGNPNGADLPRWSRFESSTRSTMVYDAVSAERRDPYRAERQWWAGRS